MRISGSLGLQLPYPQKYCSFRFNKSWDGGTNRELRHSEFRSFYYLGHQPWLLFKDYVSVYCLRRSSGPLHPLPPRSLSLQSHSHYYVLQVFLLFSSDLLSGVRWYANQENNFQNYSTCPNFISDYLIPAHIVLFLQAMVLPTRCDIKGYLLPARNG